MIRFPVLKAKICGYPFLLSSSTLGKRDKQAKWVITTPVRVNFEATEPSLSGFWQTGQISLDSFVTIKLKPFLYLINYSTYSSKYSINSGTVERAFTLFLKASERFGGVYSLFSLILISVEL